MVLGKLPVGRSKSQLDNSYCAPGVAMQTWKKQFLHFALGCVCALSLPGAVSRAAAQQTQTSSSRASNSAADADLPDSPGATLAKMEAPAQQQDSVPAATAEQSSNTSSPPQAAPQKPVGTATAEAPDTSGIAASQPAGAAIARGQAAAGTNAGDQGGCDYRRGRRGRNGGRFKRSHRQQTTGRTLRA